MEQSLSKPIKVMEQSYIKFDNSKCLSDPSGGLSNLDKSEQVRKSNNDAVLRRRAFKKHLSIKYVNRLIALDSPMRKSYERIFQCGYTIIQKNGKLTSQYCGDRWCKVCGSIRTARAIDGYGEQLKAFKDLWFLTLTAKNVKADGLRHEIGRMIKTFQKIRESARKAKIHIKGLRKLECTYNLKYDSYNPHFHLLIEGHEAARHILEAWIKRNPEANIAGQNLKKADDDSVMELLKYTFKLPADPDEVDDKEIMAADKIFQAMRRKRTLQPFGGIKAVKEDIDAEDLDAVIETDEAIERVYVWHDNDWYDIESGEPLSGYMPDDDLPPERGSPSYLCN